MDRQLPPFALVNTAMPLEMLVSQAQSKGPGVRELEGLLAVVEDARAKACGPGRFLPSLEMQHGRGGVRGWAGLAIDVGQSLGYGLARQMEFDGGLTARERRRVADAQNQQARLGVQELRAKLTLGVQEAREACLSGQEQIASAEQQIKAAEESLDLSNSRLKENIKGRSPSEVLGAIRALAGAQLTYLQAIRDYDKAQLRLFVLIGAYLD